MIDLSALPFVHFDDREKLPGSVGVYFALDSQGNVLYIGKAVHLRDRWRYHHKLSRLQKLNCSKIVWLESDRENYESLEAEFISELQPVANGRDGSLRNATNTNRPDSIVFRELEVIHSKFSRFYEEGDWS